jgi:hypothetical protein
VKGRAARAVSHSQLGAPSKRRGGGSYGSGLRGWRGGPLRTHLSKLFNVTYGRADRERERERDGKADCFLEPEQR